LNREREKYVNNNKYDIELKTIFCKFFIVSDLLFINVIISHLKTVEAAAKIRE
jgi:hypothetical protein